MWSCVKNKGNKQWRWIALDQKTSEIVGLYIGDHSKKSASELWQSLPPVYRQCGVCYTDFWQSIAILNDSTRYQAEPGNADPEALPRCSQARQSLGTLIKKRLA
jgi:IS1 family transposase